METTLKTLALRADEKGIELLCDIVEDVPATVRGDSVRLGQMLVNLVGNAIKFTNEGQVVVRVEVEPNDGENTVLHFVVSGHRHRNSERESNRRSSNRSRKPTLRQRENSAEPGWG